MSTLILDYSTVEGDKAFDAGRTEIIPNMPEGEYNALPGMRRSVLAKALIDSEALRAAIDGGTEESEATQEGTALHTAAIEPRRFEAYYRRWEKVKGKAAGAFEDACIDLAKTEPDIRLYRSDWGIEEMVAALRTHPESSAMFGENGLVGGEAECTCLWTIDGVQYKIRLDGLYRDAGVVVDLKTTSLKNLGLWHLEPEAHKWGYFFQAAMGCEALRHITGRKDWRWFNVWLRKQAGAYTVRVTEIGLDGLKFGQWQLGKARALWRKCVHTKDWTAYPGCDEILPPRYATREMDDEARASAAFGDEGGGDDDGSI